MKIYEELITREVVKKNIDDYEEFVKTCGDFSKKVGDSYKTPMKKKHWISEMNKKILHVKTFKWRHRRERIKDEQGVER